MRIDRYKYYLFFTKLFVNSEFLLFVSFCIKLAIRRLHFGIKYFDEIDITNHFLKFNHVRK